MMKRIISPRAAALALAAPLLFATPALAYHGKADKLVTGGVTFNSGNSGVHIGLGQNGYSKSRNHGYGDYRYDNNYRYNNRQAKRQAIRACRRAIRDEAYYRGFHDVDFDDGRFAEQIGPRGYRVTFNEVEFETRRREIERPVTCVVRRGDQVRDIWGIPESRRRGYRKRYNQGYYKKGLISFRMKAAAGFPSGRPVLRMSLTCSSPGGH